MLVRHGEADCNVNGVVGGMRGCTGLTARGVRQAEALRDRLLRTGELCDVRAVFASPLARARQTAEIVLPGLSGGRDGPPLSVELDPDLVELRPGEADGLTWAEFGTRFAAPDFDVRPGDAIAPGGESWTGFVDRATGAVRRIAERLLAPPGTSGGSAVLFCHAGVVEATLLRLLPVDPSVPRLGLHTMHASLTEWWVHEATWTLGRYNDVTRSAGAPGGTGPVAADDR